MGISRASISALWRGAIGANPDSAEDMVGKMFPLPPEDQVLVVKAIAYSGLPQWRDMMGTFVERMPARKDLIDKFLFGTKPVLTALSIKDDSTVIDLNWGFYFATGWEAPVRRIVAALALSQDKDKVDLMTIGAMAKWTLAQNASRDNDLLVMLKKISNDADANVKKPLAEVIDASETLELSKLRKDALASIDELKTKGPRERAQLQLVGTDGADGAGTRLRRGGRAGADGGRHSLRHRWRRLDRGAQILRARAAVVSAKPATGAKVPGLL